MDFFKDHFSNVSWSRPKIKGIPFRHISEAERVALETGFSI